MTPVGQRERLTQNRIVKLFQDELKYSYLGNWEDRSGNSNIEESLVTKYLSERGYSPAHINKALYELKAAAYNYNETFYNNNKAVYKLLRYGAQVKINAGDNFEPVQFIDWEHPEKNHFAIAEEVTFKGHREKRPDIVLYVNGIAVGVLELKRSTVSIGDGIRQSIVNQRKEFIGSFFSTIQFIFAGNDTEGLRYGTIGTPEKYFLKWKEDVEDDSRLQLDKYLIKMCNKERLIELMYDFVLFDGGIKKLPRVHQYFGIKASQEHVKRREGGIIWHTQGSGKSIVMVFLAKWILESNPNARVVIITDRDELDKQIKRVFTDAGEDIYQTSSGRDLMEQLGRATPRLLCSLIHKFGKKGVNDFEAFIRELENQPTKAVGELFLFVDECHRTQSGKFHRTMKAMIPGALFIGFSGTPLLKKDKKTSLEVFGKYIHTYKFNEAVKDEVILDLVYEARDIEQKISSPDKIDAWFEEKTKGLNDFQKSVLKQRWGTMQKVLSSGGRISKVVSDIFFDFGVKPRLNSERGNAILIARSIYDACRYFKAFQETSLKGKCAVVTSYNPHTGDITTEGIGENTETEKEFIYKTYEELLKNVQAKPGKSKTESYEDDAKDLFVNEPSNMRLVIVVDKLLVGFDAPSCTYLYIDKSMQDHGLFQAICRVNRLDGEDKTLGYIVDYRDLFGKVEDAVSAYTSDLEYDEFESKDCEILLEDRLKKGRERLEKAREAIALLCEPVESPKGTMEHIRYFCGNSEITDELKKREVHRTDLYKGTVALIRAYANIADEMVQAGYDDSEIEEVKGEINHFLKLREEIRKASGETLDLKTYEADMRYLIDNYVQAEDPRTISPFGDLSLIELIVESGIADAINSLPEGIRSNKEAIAETIINNVRQKIIRDHLIDPAFFEEISKLLDEVVKERNAKAIEYEEYLKRVAEIAKMAHAGKDDSTPTGLDTPGKRALYNNLGKDEATAIALHNQILASRPDDWKGNEIKERIIKGKLDEILNDAKEVERIFLIIREQDEY